MAALFLREADVERLLTMSDAIEAVETVFRKHALTEVANVPRGRARTDHGLIHVMGAAAKTLGLMAAKVYTTTKQQSRFLVHLYDGRTGELRAVIEANLLGAIRTGAASGVATRLMARADADTMGLFGTGFQAATQLEAVAAVRPLKSVHVYGRDEARRTAFAARMAARLNLEVIPVATPREAVAGRRIITTATTAVDPLFPGDWLEEGTHVNAVGSNFLGKTELDIEAIRRCDPIAVEDREAARIEAGELVKAVEAGAVRWSEIVELGNLVVGRQVARQGDDDITLFKSVGVAFEDLAVGKAVLDAALAAGVGEQLPF